MAAAGGSKRSPWWLHPWVGAARRVAAQRNAAQRCAGGRCGRAPDTHRTRAGRAPYARRTRAEPFLPGESAPSFGGLHPCEVESAPRPRGGEAVLRKTSSANSSTACHRARGARKRIRLTGGQSHQTCNRRASTRKQTDTPTTKRTNGQTNTTPKFG
eukprot:gene16611-biopygen8270